MMERLKNNLVFVISLFMVLVFAIPGIFLPDHLFAFATFVHGQILELFGWGYMVAALLFLLFNLYLALSKYGSFKLGQQHEKPQFSYFGWFSMLFAAGMGIGLIFWGVAEPMSHYLNPPEHIRQESGEAARFAMQYSFFHWGIQPWAIYITMSLCIAYFSFRRGMPPLISSCFYPLIGNRIYGPIGYLIDILGVFATIFGIVTSLGLGAMQITSGLGEVFRFEAGFTATLVVIAVVTVFFLISTMTGVDKGIQILSKTNIVLAIALLAFMVVMGPTVYILNIFTQTTADFATNFLSMSLSTNPFRGYEWTQSWTLFYWAWWIAWAPFVGLFVASISRGRTISEFVAGALVVPVLLTFVWFSAFGGAAFDLELTHQAGIAESIAGDVSVGLFLLYEHFPLTHLLSLITILLLSVFFITSADSATFVLSMMTSGGKLHPPTYKKLTWGLVISGTAAVLLYAGGLEALQKMAITAALPFTVIMLLMSLGLLRGLQYEVRVEGFRTDR
ncbi:BCCT family transporter [Balneolales bacterium ANBcel1]|nr:BCCT family transporter [Balneolales bacterium ANBcel1]